jgi:hypothetical protein
MAQSWMNLGAVVHAVHNFFMANYFLLVANIITEATCVFYRPYKKYFFKNILPFRRAMHIYFHTRSIYSRCTLDNGIGTFF